MLQESGDASQYRVPISLGEPHPVNDNSGSECTAYDVIVNFKFLETVQVWYILCMYYGGVRSCDSVLVARR